MLRLYKVVRAAWAQAKSLCYQNLSGGAGHAPGAAFGDVAVGFVPAHGAFERSGDRAGLETQFALRARTIHEHHVARDFYAFDRNAWFAPEEPRENRTGIGYTQGETVGNFQFGRGQTGNLRKRIEHLLQREILPTEQVAFADFSFFRDKQVAGGAIFDADKIEAGLDIAGHFAVQEIEDDFSGGCGLPVPGADRRGGHGDDHGESVFRGAEGFLFREPFRTLVMANHLFEPGVRELIRMLGTVDGDSGDGAGIDELLDAGALCGIQKIFCAADVRIVEVLLAPGPQAVIRGDVEDPLDILHGAIERGGIAQVSGDIFEREIGNGAIGAGGAHEHADVISARDELARYVAAQKSGRSCDQRGHETRRLSSEARAGCVSLPGAWRISLVCAAERSSRSTCPESARHCRWGMRFRASRALLKVGSPIVAAVIIQPSTSATERIPDRAGSRETSESSLTGEWTAVKKPESRAARRPSSANSNAPGWRSFPPAEGGGPSERMVRKSCGTGWNS